MTSIIVPIINKQANTIDTTLSTWGLTNTISEFASLQAAVQNVIKADINRSSITN